MDSNQADAVAKAILQPDLEAREDSGRRREAEAVTVRRQRRTGWFGLAGFAMGAALGYFAFDRIFPYGFMGLFLAVLVGHFVPYRRAG